MKQMGSRPCANLLAGSLQIGAKGASGNDSTSVWECMTWGDGGNPRNILCSHNQGVNYHLSRSVQLESYNTQVKCGCCPEGEYIDTSAGGYTSNQERGEGNQGGDRRQIEDRGRTGKGIAKTSGDKQKQTRVTHAQNSRGQAASAQKKEVRVQSKARNPAQEMQPAYDRMAIEETRKRRLNDLIKSRERSVERQRVEEFVDSQKPYTRGMSDTRFRTLFGKECMEAYGRNNTNEPIGGIIYGNNLKTFNINPHASSNDPKYYQTHTTAINFAKRTKLDEEKRWKLLEKQFGKELHLESVNQTLIPGKETAVQEVTPENMYLAMKVNHEFKRENREEIRQAENDYKRSVVEKQWAKEDQYKAQRAADKELLKAAPLASTMAASEAEDQFRTAAGSAEDRLSRQVIYKLVDKDGHVRFGADRHALTCFVDTNFPENAAAYTAELVNRNSIFPIRVREEDRNLDEIRKENFVESVVNNYPNHYLIPNVDYSQVNLQPRRNRSRSPTRQKRPQSYNPKPQSYNPVPQSTSHNDNPAITNAKVGTRINAKVGSPKYQKERAQQNATTSKGDYLAQSTNNTLERTRSPPLNNTHHQQQQQSLQQANSQYAATLKSALLEESSRNPHYATQLLVRASENFNPIPPHNQRVVNQQYDPQNYYPHATHEMNPQLHQRIRGTKIPYAGVQSSILDAKIQYDYSNHDVSKKRKERREIPAFS